MLFKKFFLAQGFNFFLDETPTFFIKEEFWLFNILNVKKKIMILLLTWQM